MTSNHSYPVPRVPPAYPGHGREDAYPRVPPSIGVPGTAATGLWTPPKKRPSVPSPNMVGRTHTEGHSREATIDPTVAAASALAAKRPARPRAQGSSPTTTSEWERGHERAAPAPSAVDRCS